jgi:hypothetical protein
MRKHGSIVYKWRQCLPKGPTSSARSAAAAIFANGTYFVDKESTITNLVN